MSKGLTRSLGRAAPTVDPGVRRFRYPVRNVSVTVAAAAAGVGFGTVVIGDLPEGNLLSIGGGGYLSFSTADTDLTATWNGDYSVGTSPDADGTLAGAEINLLTSQPIGPAVARVSLNNRNMSAADASEVFDNTDNAMEVNLNVLVDAADITDAQSAVLTVNGFIDLVFIVIGDD
jgi:hypothetical protein